MSNKECLAEIECGYRMEKPPNCPQPIYDEILNTWEMDANDRPTFKYLQNFFENYSVSMTEDYYVNESFE